MELYFIKLRASSKLTAEEILGYMLGKIGELPDYDFVVVPSRYSRMLNMVSLKDDYNTFVENFKRLKKRVEREAGEASSLTKEFLNYFQSQISRKSGRLLGAELGTAVKESDIDVVKVILTELLSGWSSKIEVDVEATAISLEEFSVSSFQSQISELDDELILNVFQRPDVKDLPEIFPVIDPIDGKSLDEFDVGDSIYFVVLNLGSEENKKKLLNDFPDRFEGKTSNIPFPGTLVSKELVRSKKGGYHYLIKVDFGNGVLGKALIPKSLKILSSEKKYKTKIADESEEEWLGKIGEILEETEKETVNLKKLKELSEPPPIVKSSKMDFLIAFLLTLLFIGVFLIISYLFFG